MIRKMQSYDKEAYLDMAEAFYASDAVIKKVSRQVMEATFHAIVTNDPYVEGYMLLDEQGQVAGYALLAHSFSQEAGGRVLWVDEIYLRPTHRGRGLAKAFFDDIKQLYAHSVRRIRLDVEADNTKAIALYERAGMNPLPYAQMIFDF